MVNPSLNWKSLIRDGLFLVMAEALGITRVAMFHGWDPKMERHLRSLWGRVLFRPFKRANHVIVLSSSFRRELRALGVKSPIHILCTAIDAATEQAARCSCSSGSDRGKRAEPGSRLLFISRIVRAKGVFTCLEALDLLEERLPDVSLVIAGDGPDLPEVNAWLREHPRARVALAGDVRGAEKVSVMAGCDTLVLPTTYGEGMPIVVLEGLALGLTPVVTAVAGLQDMRDHGLPIVVLPNSGQEALASAVLELFSAENHRRSLAERGRVAALKYFTPSAVATLLDRVLCLALEGANEEVEWWLEG